MPDIGRGRAASTLSAGTLPSSIGRSIISRRPPGHLNGELCCTADLILTGDTLRQAVVEIRQLMAWLRAKGSVEFGLLGLLGPPGENAAERTLIVGGSFDRIVRMSDLVVLRNAWPGAKLVTVPQAHFGFTMIPRAMSWLRERELLATKDA